MPPVCDALRITVSNATDSIIRVGFQNQYPDAALYNGTVMRPEGAAAAEGRILPRSRADFSVLPGSSDAIAMFLVRFRTAEAARQMAHRSLLSVPLSTMAGPQARTDYDLLYQSFRYDAARCRLRAYPGTTSTSAISVAQSRDAETGSVEFLVRDGSTAENAVESRTLVALALVLGAVAIAAIAALILKARQHAGHPLHPSRGQSRRSEWRPSG